MDRDPRAGSRDGTPPGDHELAALRAERRFPRSVVLRCVPRALRGRLLVCLLASRWSGKASGSSEEMFGSGASSYLENAEAWLSISTPGPRLCTRRSVALFP